MLFRSSAWFVAPTLLLCAACTRAGFSASLPTTDGSQADARRDAAGDGQPGGDLELDAPGGREQGGPVLPAARRIGAPVDFFLGQWPTQALAVDAQGNIYLCGRIHSPVDFGGGTLAVKGVTEAYLLSLDASASFRWARAFGGDDFSDYGDRCNGVVATGSRVVVAGTVNQNGSYGGQVHPANWVDIFLASYAPSDGSYQWSAVFGDEGEEVVDAIAYDAARDLVVAAGSVWSSPVDVGNGPFTQGPSGWRGFIASYQASSGAYQGSRTFVDEAQYEIFAAGIAVDDAGNRYYGATFKGTGSFGGTTLGSGSIALLYASYDGSWAHRWSDDSSISSNGADPPAWTVAALDRSLDRFIVAAGTRTSTNFGLGPVPYVGGSDLTVASMQTSDGSVVWSRATGGAGDEQPTGVGTDAQGNIYVAGFYTSATLTIGADTLTNHGGRDIFVASFGPTGAPRWARGYGGSGDDIAVRLAVAPDGKVHVVAAFNDTVDFDGTSLIAQATNDGALLTFTR